MSSKSDPIIKLEPGGRASILSYNVPEPISYSGRNMITTEFDPNFFKDEPGIRQPPKRASIKDYGQSGLSQIARESLLTGFFDPNIFPNIKINTNTLAIRAIDQNDANSTSTMSNPTLSSVGEAIPIRNVLARLDPDAVASRLMGGERLNIYRNLHGFFDYNFLPEPTTAKPRLILIETYRLSSFLGNYGAGKTIKTFSLLPGEKTRISIKTYFKTPQDAKSASSILDSFNEESSKSYEDSIQAEQSDKKNSSESFEYHAEADARASWGWGSANISGGIKGGTNSAREEFAKNTANATQKHSARASSKRDVQINTSFETKVDTGEETSIEREIANINVSRTLNFVFRQMNQEFITLLHLVEVRVGFFNGFAESKREIALPELDKLLEQVIVEDRRKEVRDAILDQLQNIFDYKDFHHSFVEERPLKDRNGNDVPNSQYLRVTKDYVSVYKDDATGTEKSIPGIILSAQKTILRTDGIIVDALLGQGDGLDDYSHGLQDQAVRARELANQLTRAQIEREKLGQSIVEAKDEAAAKIFHQVFPPQPKADSGKDKLEDKDPNG